MKEQKLESAAIVSLFYESVFASNSWIGLSDQPLAPGSGLLETTSRQGFGRAELEPVLPYLEQALSNQANRLKNDPIEGAPLPGLEDLPLPVVIVTSGLEIVSMTGAARNILDGGFWLERRGSQLISQDESYYRRLKMIVKETLESKESRSLNPGPGNNPPGTVLLAPLPDNTVENGGGERSVAMFFNFEFEDINKIIPFLIEAHGLTSSEAGVVAHLIKGQSLEDISESRNLSIHTIRTHIKNVYAKTGTRRQSELVSLVLYGPAMWLRLLETERQETHTLQPSYPASDRQMTLRDGRVLSYGDFGPASGVPVILFHQLYGIRTERKKDEALLRELNIRLVVPERPGVGVSSRHPGQRLEDYSDDICELADRLELERFCVIGISGGGPFAMACSVHLRERVMRLGLVASDIPIDEMPGGTKVGLPRTMLTSLSRHWPKGAKALLEMRFRKMYADSEAAIVDFFEGGSEPDKALLRDPEIYSICKRNLREAGQIPADVLAEELIMLSRPWGFSVTDIGVPTHLWHRRQDHYCSPEHAEALSTLIPDCTPIIRDDWGHYFYYGQWRSLLVQITE